MGPVKLGRFLLVVHKTHCLTVLTPFCFQLLLRVRLARFRLGNMRQSLIQRRKVRGSVESLEFLLFRKRSLWLRRVLCLSNASVKALVRELLKSMPTAAEVSLALFCI